MKVLLAHLVSLSTSTSSPSKDAIFNEWCTNVGILCDHAEVRTGPESVGGRGVFSTNEISRGNVAISIPRYLAFTRFNAAGYFPVLANALEECRREKQGYLKRIWNRIRRKPEVELSEEDDFWQAELTAYALATLETDHPWSTWISQWNRDDPMQSLVDQSTWKFDDEAVNVAISDFGGMAPDIPKYKINAAVQIRLDEINEYTDKYENKVPTSESMYTTLISRAIGVSDSITACLPMHDMINHSTDPNLAFTFCDGNFELVALRDIAKDEELFLSYMDVANNEGDWDEDKATWLLVQWGIPSSPLKPAIVSLSENQNGLEQLESLSLL